MIYLHFRNLISEMFSTRAIFDMRDINVTYFHNEESFCYRYEFSVRNFLHIL